MQPVMRKKNYYITGLYRPFQQIAMAGNYAFMNLKYADLHFCMCLQCVSGKISHPKHQQ